MNKTLLVLLAILLGGFSLQAASISVANEEGVLWTLSEARVAQTLKVAPPIFEIDGRGTSAAVERLERVSEREVFAHVRELVYCGRLKNVKGASLKVIFRIAEGSPVVRFRYELCADQGVTIQLTKANGKDCLTYFTTDLSAWPKRTEVRISEFSNIDHAYRMSEREVMDAEFENELPFMGPILAAEGQNSAALLAYEHGSQVPNAYLSFCGQSPAKMSVRAVKGNYWRGEKITADNPYATIWFDVALVAGGTDELAAAFRTHILKFLTDNAATRKPWVCYNTWALQERDYWWHGSRRYLNAMNEKEMLAEIDAAHEMGIEIFVIDTGWFEKTGDWRVSQVRFPNGMEPIRAKLKSYNMKLGLWFDPLAAAVTSDMMKRNRKNVMKHRGKESPKKPVWESEESQELCLVSDYWKDFADEMIRLYHECGVTYFKWDAIGQIWCDAAGHLHGDATISELEREECCSFEQVRYMGRIIERLRAACPDAIVDFDITEGARTVGLAFLEHGRYFAYNNGPYYPDFDYQYDWANPKHWVNVLVNPGPARPIFVRRLLNQDKWLPSTLFMAHYLPDAPRTSQVVNLASLILGQNGIWGELQKLSPEDRRYFNEFLTMYKKVRDDIAEASPVQVGAPTGSPEIYEKLTSKGRGVVVIFSSEAGEHTYVTRTKVAPVLWKSENMAVTTDAKGRAVLRAKFAPGVPLVAFVFFGE